MLFGSACDVFAAVWTLLAANRANGTIVARRATAREAVGFAEQIALDAATLSLEDIIPVEMYLWMRLRGVKG